MEHTVFYVPNIALLTYDSGGLKVVSLTQKLKKIVFTLECFGKSPPSIVTKLLYQKVV